MENHKVFVSYKFSDGVDTRVKIMNKLGSRGHIYKGEKGFERLELADNTIKEYLKDMIFDSSVTVVIISPQVTQSAWVDWEIRYSLTSTTRNGKTSKRNGIVCVIQNETTIGRLGGLVKNTSWSRNVFGRLRSDIFPPAIISNLQNTFGTSGNVLESMGLTDDYEGCQDYAIVVSENTFLNNPDRYINAAFQRAQDTTNYPVNVRK